MMDTRCDDLYAIIRHPKHHHRVLLCEGRDGWMLPGATVALTPTDHRWRDTVRVNRAISDALGSRHDPRVRACQSLSSSR